MVTLPCDRRHAGPSVPAVAERRIVGLELRQVDREKGVGRLGIGAVFKAWRHPVAAIPDLLLDLDQGGDMPAPPLPHAALFLRLAVMDDDLPAFGPEPLLHPFPVAPLLLCRCQRHDDVSPCVFRPVFTGRQTALPGHAARFPVIGLQGRGSRAQGHFAALSVLTLRSFTAVSAAGVATSVPRRLDSWRRRRTLCGHDAALPARLRRAFSCGA